MYAKTKITFLTTLIALGMAACGGDKKAGDDAAYLTIVGDQNVFLDNQDITKLRVRYHDGNDAPLAGTVDFRIVGTNGGAVIDKQSGNTSADGVVELQVTAGASGAASFQIEASAYAANPARWTINVGKGVPDLDPTGRYQLSSKLDIVSGLDNDVGNVLNTFIDMTDDENDPATWIIDQLVAQLDSTTASFVNAFRSSIDPKVNEFLLEHAPDFVDKLLAIGNGLGDVTRNFGMTSTLEVSRNQSGDVDAPGLLGTHQVTGVFFDINGNEMSWTMEELGVSPIEAEDVIITKDGMNMLHISNHELPLTYGSAIRVALEQGIIPLLDSDANSLSEFMLGMIDCDGIGEYLHDEVGGLSSSAYANLCEVGVEAGAGAIIDQILDIDDVGVNLSIAGVTRPRDTNGDGDVDELQAGKWNGFISYAGSESAMNPDDNTFSGVRLSSNE